MIVKFSDLQKQYLQCKSEIDTAIQKVLDNGNYILGLEVGEFENNYTNYCNAKHCVGIDNGLNSLELALRVLGIGKDDSVILPANTFVATALAVSAVGAKIRLCDVDEETQLVTSLTISNVMSSSVRCIIPVHLFGQMCDMGNIAFIAENSVNCKIIEDACQSHGATWRGHMAGAYSDMACYSFYPAKNLGGISDGGAITVNNTEWRNQLLAMRNYGSTKKYFHDTVGMNARLSTINAAVLSIKLKHLDDWNAERSHIADYYNQQLSNVGDIKIPVMGVGNTHVYHLYVIRTSRRDALQKYLTEHDIQTGIHYPLPIHRQLAYKDYDFGSNNSFPVTEKLSKEILSLPMHPFLTIDEIDFVCQTIRNFFKQ